MTNSIWSRLSGKIYFDLKEIYHGVMMHTRCDFCCYLPDLFWCHKLLEIMTYTTKKSFRLNQYDSANNPDKKCYHLKLFTQLYWSIVLVLDLPCNIMCTVRSGKHHTHIYLCASYGKGYLVLKPPPSWILASKQINTTRWPVDWLTLVLLKYFPIFWSDLIRFDYVSPMR
jgi:hypothetical protein